ncbi:hypothetical protein BDP81DRAFT_321785 [Colletotrichum phormii]|uniref:Uncharacterized protein n=1 Tax=Colletotrichum phormii TaxID=359342 RepID=A0AAJ0EE07_9PEZI|nr:uncharacterized protein BDP81DRAFT_321785 [Colletotrichum phormii]KAK1635514.1 hypothetical protein BDP81DRAFT_321785 [Colletotrichum phormii]
MESRTRYEYLRRDWLETVSKEVGLKALELISAQHQRALPSLPTDQIPRPPDLPPCSGSFTNQYRLSCSHKLLDLMKRKEPLTKMYIHPRWSLRQPLNFRDALLNIKDPAVVTTLRGRPKNKNIAYHGTLPTPSSSGAPTSSAAPGRPTARAPRQPRRAQYPASRPVRQSIRRNRSAFKYDDEDELASQSTQSTIIVGGSQVVEVEEAQRPAAKRRSRRLQAPPASTAPAQL